MAASWQLRFRRDAVKFTTCSARAAHLPGEADAARMRVVQQQPLGPVPRVVRVVALGRHVAGRAHEEQRQDVDERVPGTVDAVAEGQALLGDLLARCVWNPQVCRLRSEHSYTSCRILEFSTRDRTKMAVSTHHKEEQGCKTR